MPVAKKTKEFLDKNGVKYLIISHSRAYTAQEIAASTHIPGKELAKSVIVKVDGELVMVVLPASYKINFDLLSSALGSKDTKLATEDDFKAVFPDCEIGAMPPFGNLYDVPVYMAKSLEEDIEIAFNAGTHTEVIRLAMEDYKRLVNPKTIKISEHI